jgi:uncharacterized protein YkwD
MKSLALFAVLIAVLGGIVFFEQHTAIIGNSSTVVTEGFPGPLRGPESPPVSTPSPAPLTATPTKSTEAVPETTTVSVIKKLVSAAAPLVSRDAPDTPLTADGVFAWTNVSRIREDAKPILTRNPKLDEVARLRAADMFQKQYFEHTSPDGTGASDIAEKVGYAYLGIGENIALGGFGSDEKLVEAWMNSPHHRDNILNTKFTDLGVATVEGVYEGRKTWIGVQIFGRPFSSCRKPDTQLLVSIDQNKNLMKILDGQIRSLNIEIQTLRSSSPVPVDEYNRKVAEYNELVNQLNPLSLQTKQMVEVYNDEVKTYNSCIVM